MGTAQIESQHTVTETKVATVENSFDSSLNTVTKKLFSSGVNLVVLVVAGVLAIFYFWPQVTGAVQYFSARDQHESSVNRSISNLQAALATARGDIERLDRANQEKNVHIGNLTWRVDVLNSRYEKLEAEYRDHLQGKSRTITEVELQTILGIMRTK